MSAFKSAHFKGTVQVDSTLSGPTITTINSNATSTLNSLNSQIANYLAEQSSTAQRFADAQASRTAMQSASAQAFADAYAQMGADKVDSDSKLAQEKADRLASEQTQSNKNSSLDGEILQLNNLHSSDDARLTAVESALQTVDTDLQNQIQERINAHNADLQDTLPRLAKIEDYFVIDESDPNEPVIRFKENVKVVCSGEFIQG